MEDLSDMAGEEGEDPVPAQWPFRNDGGTRQQGNHSGPDSAPSSRADLPASSGLESAAAGPVLPLTSGPTDLYLK
jgi:hypothetical protein